MNLNEIIIFIIILNKDFLIIIMLWKNIFYGPVFSRRLGHSLGINLLPNKRKICNFNCVYCECGLNQNNENIEPLPSFDEYENGLVEILKTLKGNNQRIDHFTFSGNGEPTLHPDFGRIIDKTIELRDIYYPSTKIAVLTNSLRINNEKIYLALKKIEMPICKLDAGSEETYQMIDQPVTNITLDQITENLKIFEGNLVIQTIFLRGRINNNFIDNTTLKEINLWIGRLKQIKPKLVMIYCLDRTPPYPTLEKISPEELKMISEQVKNAGFEVESYS